MKSLIAAGVLALSLAPIVSTVARADDVGAAIARGAIRGALGDNGYRDRDYGRDYDRDYRRDRFEGRSAYEGDCRTVTVQRDTPDGVVTRTTRRCD